MNSKCVCCGGSVEVPMANNKYCSRCSLYLAKLRQENAMLRQKVKRYQAILKELRAKTIQASQPLNSPETFP